MKIFEVAYIGEDDTTKHLFFSSGAEARKKYRRLQKMEKQDPEEDEFGDENRMVKTLFDISEFEVEISKTGILNLLNTRFSETQ